jgi:hypothetical protein
MELHDSVPSVVNSLVFIDRLNSYEKKGEKDKKSPIPPRMAATRRFPFFAVPFFLSYSTTNHVLLSITQRNAQTREPQTNAKT